MSSTIWTECGGTSNLRPLVFEATRVVEAQHVVSTRKLVDSDAEQALLEALIETAKPPDPTQGRLHYLLSTPFRYPPLRHGSRFGSRFEVGIWYGSEGIRTALAETAYYRLLFLEGTEANLGTVEIELTSFSVRITSRSGIHLGEDPFLAHRGSISSPVHYRRSQALGRAMREDGVEAALFQSARDAKGGLNVAAFTPVVFGRARPKAFHSWYAAASRTRVDFRKRDFMRPVHMSFPREEFLVRGDLPAPAL